MRKSGREEREELRGKEGGGGWRRSGGEDETEGDNEEEERRSRGGRVGAGGGREGGRSEEAFLECPALHEVVDVTLQLWSPMLGRPEQILYDFQNLHRLPLVRVMPGNRGHSLRRRGRRVLEHVV